MDSRVFIGLQKRTMIKRPELFLFGLIASLTTRIMEKKRIVLLIGRGSCVPWVYDVLDPNRVEVELAISHKKEAPGLDVVKKHGGNTLLAPMLRFEKMGLGTRDDYMDYICKVVAMARPDLVLCLGWDLILAAKTVAFWSSIGAPTVNLHPSLVSSDGKPVQTEYGLIPVIAGEVSHVVKETLIQGLRATGCSLHIIPETAEVDCGPVLLRRIVGVLDDDTPEMLEYRIHAQERPMVQELIRIFQETGSLPAPIG